MSIKVLFAEACFQRQSDHTQSCLPAAYCYEKKHRFAHRCLRRRVHERLRHWCPLCLAGGTRPRPKLVQVEWANISPRVCWPDCSSTATSRFLEGHFFAVHLLVRPRQCRWPLCATFFFFIIGREALNLTSRALNALFIIQEKPTYRISKPFI